MPCLICAAKGSGEAIMAGLNCAVPCTLAWDILGGFACSDEVTRRGMPPVVPGESACRGR